MVKINRNIVFLEACCGAGGSDEICLRCFHVSFDSTMRGLIVWLMILIKSCPVSQLFRIYFCNYLLLFGAPS